MALDRTTAAERIGSPLDQAVLDSLMVPLEMIVLDVLANDSPKMTFAERDQLADAL